MKRARGSRSWALAAWLAVSIVVLSPAHAGPAAQTPPPKLASQPVRSAAELTRLFAQLAGIASLHATFAESKKITLLIKPLASSGELYFHRELGLARMTMAPSPQKVVLTGKTLSLWDGRVVRHTALADAREVAAIATAFPMLLRGDQAGLARLFRLELRGDVAAWWMLTLTPQRGSLAKMLRNIVIVGQGRNIYALEVSEANGDQTRTVFDNVVVNGAMNADAQKTWFAMPTSGPL